MNFKLVLVSALAAGTMLTAGMAQTAASPSKAAPAAPPAPEAIPAKIAVIELEQVAEASNEGQKAVDALQKKYEPQRQQLESRRNEIDSLTKQLQDAPASMSQDERDSRARNIDLKQKQLERDAQDAQSAYTSDVQEAIANVEQKLGPVVVKYVAEHGFTMLFDNTGQPQQGGLNLLWAPRVDISRAVLDAYNASSGVAAPMPSAPAANRPRTTTPKK